LAEKTMPYFLINYRHTKNVIPQLLHVFMQEHWGYKH